MNHPTKASAAISSQRPPREAPTTEPEPAPGNASAVAGTRPSGATCFVGPGVFPLGTTPPAGAGVDVAVTIGIGVGVPASGVGESCGTGVFVCVA